MRRAVLAAVLGTTLGIVPSATSGPGPAGPSGRIAYSERFWPKDERISDNWEILVRKAGGGRAVNLTRNGYDEFFPAWSRSGTWIAFARGGGRSAGISVIRDDGSGRRRVVRLPNRQLTSLAWSPDDRKLAFAVGKGIGTVNMEGTGLRRVSGGRDSSPTWSADGRTIAFQRTVRGVSDVLQMRANGGGARLIARKASAPAWSPDGQTIAFIRRGWIVLMDPDGGRQRRVPGIPGPANGWGVMEVAWSPDSRYLAYQHYGSDAIVRGLHVSAVDGTSRRLLFEFLDPLPGITWGP